MILYSRGLVRSCDNLIPSMCPLLPCICASELAVVSYHDELNSRSSNDPLLTRSRENMLQTKTIISLLWTLLQTLQGNDLTWWAFTDKVSHMILYSHVANWNHKQTPQTFPETSIAGLDRVVSYREEITPSFQSHVLMGSCGKLTPKCIWPPNLSPLPQYLWLPNLARWRHTKHNHTNIKTHNSL